MSATSEAGCCLSGSCGQGWAASLCHLAAQPSSVAAGSRVLGSRVLPAAERGLRADFPRFFTGPGHVSPLPPLSSELLGIPCAPPCAVLCPPSRRLLVVQAAPSQHSLLLASCSAGGGTIGQGLAGPGCVPFLQFLIRSRPRAGRWAAPARDPRLEPSPGSCISDPGRLRVLQWRGQKLESGNPVLMPDLHLTLSKSALAVKGYHRRVVRSSQVWSLEAQGRDACAAGLGVAGRPRLTGRWAERGAGA